MNVVIADAPFISEYQGKTYHFCAPGCKAAFDADPTRFLAKKPE